MGEGALRYTAVAIIYGIFFFAVFRQECPPAASLMRAAIAARICAALTFWSLGGFS